MTPNIDLAERMKVIAARINEGRDTYAGRLDAWHKLGLVVGKFATADELIEAAKANYQVVVRQLEWKGKLIPSWGTFRVDGYVPKGLEDIVIPVKSINDSDRLLYLSFLANVGKDFNPINHRGIMRLLDALVGQIDGAHYETMGTLDFGAKVWAQVNPNFKIRVGEDETDIYLSFRTAYDGSIATEVYETGVRKVCRNTFNLGSLKRLGQTLRVKRTKNAQKKIDTWVNELEEIKSVALSMQDKLVWLANKKVTKPSLIKVMDRLFPKKQTEEGEESSTRRDNIIAEILDTYAYNDGNTFPEQSGTAYALWNGVTNYTDHLRSTKGDMRAESALFGSGDKLKRNALDIILEEAEGMPTKEKSVVVDFAEIGLNIQSNSN